MKSSIYKIAILLSITTLLLAGCSGQQVGLVQTKAAQELSSAKLSFEATSQAQAAVFETYKSQLEAQLVAAQATATSTPEPEPTAQPTVTPTPPMPVKPVQTDPMKLTLAEGLEIELVRVPAGEFLMGASDEFAYAEKDEKPQHTVYLDEYLIGKTEITLAQYRFFIRATGNIYPYPDRLPPEGQDNYPVTYLYPENAQAFVAWLSEWTGRKVTLPSEAQWEKAARGASGTIYPWGNHILDCTYANVAHCNETTQPVGSYPLGASPYGTLDMIGNVSEMVSDIYQAKYYSISPTNNPTGPEIGTNTVQRGGCFYTYWDAAHSTNRSQVSFENWTLVSYCEPGIRIVVAVEK